MEYEDYNEEGLHYRRKRPKNEEPLPPSKRYVVDNAQARKALATIVETKKTSKAKVPEFPEIGLKVKSSYADKPSNIRVLYLIEEIADQMKANLKESYIEHPILLNASISMLDEIFENCKTELNKYNDFKHRQLEEEAKINEDIKKLKSDEDTK